MRKCLRGKNVAVPGYLSFSLVLESGRRTKGADLLCEALCFRRTLFSQERLTLESETKTVLFDSQMNHLGLVLRRLHGDSPVAEQVLFCVVCQG